MFPIRRTTGQLALVVFGVALLTALIEWISRTVGGAFASSLQASTSIALVVVTWLYVALTRELVAHQDRQLLELRGQARRTALLPLSAQLDEATRVPIGEVFPLISGQAPDVDRLVECMQVCRETVRVMDRTRSEVREPLLSHLDRTRELLRGVVDALETLQHACGDAVTGGTVDSAAMSSRYAARATLYRMRRLPGYGALFISQPAVHDEAWAELFRLHQMIIDELRSPVPSSGLIAA